MNSSVFPDKNESGNLYRVSHFLPFYEMPSSTVNEALEELREEITKIMPLRPKTYRSEEDKVECLRGAVIGTDCAHRALSQRYAVTPPWSFQQ